MTNVYYSVMEFFDVSFCDYGYVCAHVCARASSFLRVCGLDSGIHQSASYWALLAGGDTAGPRRSNDRIPIPTEGRTQEKVKNTTCTFCPEAIAFKYLPGSLARARLYLRSSTHPLSKFRVHTSFGRRSIRRFSSFSASHKRRRDGPIGGNSLAAVSFRAGHRRPFFTDDVPSKRILPEDMYRRFERVSAIICFLFHKYCNRRIRRLTSEL